jgi:anti-anti-sigma factor
MTTCTITQHFGVIQLSIVGRIDGMSSFSIQEQLNELIMGGSRIIVADLEKVNFLSSAGLRVFLGAQKELNTVGGEIILFKPTELVMRVFNITGLDALFKTAFSDEELAAFCSGTGNTAEFVTTSIDGISVKFREIPNAEPGTIRIIGSQEKLSTSDYTQKDVITISQAMLPFGAGLATVGDLYDEYKHLFGEAVIINSHIYFYPAVKRPVVDYMFYSSKDEGTDCRFLNGFGFSGQFCYLAGFEASNDFITLDRLIQWAVSLPLAAPLLGIVFLAESKGLYGMNLKKIPIRENKSAEEVDIFNVANVASWINFPTDPTDQDNVIAATGLICRDKASCPAHALKLFSSESNAHIHAGIFAKGPISKNINQFPEELERILTSLDVKKVQHLLGQSRFSNGMLGLVELKG